MAADANDERIIDESGIWTRDFDRWIRKSLLVNWDHSKLYVRTPDGELMPVTSVRIDRQSDIRFGYGDVSKTFCAALAMFDVEDEDAAPIDKECGHPLDSNGQCPNFLNHISRGTDVGM